MKPKGFYPPVNHEKRERAIFAKNHLWKTNNWWITSVQKNLEVEAVIVVVPMRRPRLHLLHHHDDIDKKKGKWCLSQEEKKNYIFSLSDARNYSDGPRGFFFTGNGLMLAWVALVVAFNPFLELKLISWCKNLIFRDPVHHYSRMCLGT